MVLIDTSCWTHALQRKGNPTIRAKVKAHLASSQAAWCDPVRLELNVPASDLLILACARHHGVSIEHADRHYVLLGQLK